MKCFLPFFFMFALLACGDRHQNCRINVPAPLKNMDDFVNYSGATYAYPLVYSYLAIIDPDGALHFDLAESCTYSPSSLSWKIRLRRAIFHDGQPVTVRDVAYSIGRGITTINSVSDNIDGILLFNEMTMIIRLKKEDPSFFARIAFIEIVPFDSKDPFIGSGPYRIERFDADQMTLRRNPTFYGSTPKLETIEIFCVKDPIASIQSVLSGQTEIVYDIVVTKEIESLIGNGRITLSSTPCKWITALINEDTLPEIKARVDIIRAMSSETEREYAGPLPSQLRLLTPKIDPYPHVAESIQQQLKAFGVSLSMETQEANEFVCAITAERREWDIALTELNISATENTDYWFDMFGSRGHRGLFRHPWLSILIMELPLATDSRKREIYARMQKLLKDQALSAPLCPRSYVAIQSPRVKTPIVFTPYGLRAFVNEAAVRR